MKRISWILALVMLIAAFSTVPAMAMTGQDKSRVDIILDGVPYDMADTLFVNKGQVRTYSLGSVLAALGITADLKDGEESGDIVARSGDCYNGGEFTAYRDGYLRAFGQDIHFYSREKYNKKTQCFENTGYVKNDSTGAVYKIEEAANSSPIWGSTAVAPFFRWLGCNVTWDDKNRNLVIKSPVSADANSTLNVQDYEDDIKWCKENGLIITEKDGSFDPYHKVTAVEMLDLAYKIIGKEFMIDYLDKYAEMGNFESTVGDQERGIPSSYAPEKGVWEKRFLFIARNEDYVRPERGEYNFPNEWADGFIHFTLAKNEGGNDSRYKWDVRLQEAWKNLGYGEEVQPIPNEYKVALAYFISTNIGAGPMPWEVGCNADACWVSPKEAADYVVDYYMISEKRALNFEWLARGFEMNSWYRDALDVIWINKELGKYRLILKDYSRRGVISETKNYFIKVRWGKNSKFKSSTYITNMELCDIVAKCGQFRTKPYGLN